MSSKSCERDLDTVLPQGVKGRFSVEKVTSTGHTTDCKVDSDDHFIHLRIRNNSPVQCVVRFVIEIQDGKVEFERIKGQSYSDFKVITPMGKYGSPFEVRLQIEEKSVKRLQTDGIDLQMKAEAMDIPNPPPISTTLDIDVN
jgi:regulation of enolase protein 1 (concanavalin A-like superfamily)